MDKLVVKKKIVDLVAHDEIDEIITRKIGSLADLSRAVSDLYTLDQRFDIGKIQVRFLMGALLLKTGSKYGENTVEAMAQQYNISATTLREARQLAKHFGNSPRKLKIWMDGVTRQRGRVYWTDIQELIRSGSDPRVLGQEAMTRRLITRVERVARDAEVLNEALADIPDDLKAEHDGAVAVMYENVKAVQNQYEKLNKAGQTIIPRSETYLQFVRAQPCPITGDDAPEAHHALGFKGTGKKASDFGTVPLSAKLHRQLHDKGREWFEGTYGVDLAELALNYMHKFLTNQWLTMEL
jgi:hypothetical protein